MRKKGIYCPRTLDTLDRKVCQACEYFTMLQTKRETECQAPFEAKNSFKAE